MRIQLFNLLKTKKVSFLILTIFAAVLVLITTTSPSLTVNCQKDISIIHTQLNKCIHDLKTDFEKHVGPSFNPFEESKEVKKISGILNEASKFNYVHGISSSYKLSTDGGDCGAMSDWLYNHIKKQELNAELSSMKHH